MQKMDFFRTEFTSEYHDRDHDTTNLFQRIFAHSSDSDGADYGEEHERHDQHTPDSHEIASGTFGRTGSPNLIPRLTLARQSGEVVPSTLEEYSASPTREAQGTRSTGGKGKSPAHYTQRTSTNHPTIDPYRDSDDYPTRLSPRLVPQSPRGRTVHLSEADSSSFYLGPEGVPCKNTSQLSFSRSPHRIASAMDTDYALDSSSKGYRQFEKALEQQRWASTEQISASRPTSQTMPTVASPTISSSGLEHPSHEVSHPAETAVPASVTKGKRRASQFGYQDSSSSSTTRQELPATRERTVSEPWASVPPPTSINVNIPARRSEDAGRLARQHQRDQSKRRHRSVSAAEGESALARTTLPHTHHPRPLHSPLGTAVSPSLTPTIMRWDHAQATTVSLRHHGPEWFGNSNQATGNKISSDESYLPRSGRPSSSSVMLLRKRVLANYHLGALSALRARIPLRPSTTLSPIKCTSWLARIDHTTMVIRTYAHVAATFFFDYHTLYAMAQVAADPDAGTSRASWWVAFGIYAASFGVWLIGITILYEIVFQYYRRWINSRPFALPIYLSSPSFRLTAIRSFSLYSLLYRTRYSATPRDFIIETFWFYSQNWPTVLTLLPRGVIITIFLINYHPGAPPRTSTNFSRDPVYFDTNSGLLTSFSYFILLVNAAWIAWRIFVLLLAGTGLFIVLGPYYVWLRERRGYGLEDKMDVAKVDPTLRYSTQSYDDNIGRTSMQVPNSKSSPSYPPMQQSSKLTQRQLANDRENRAAKSVEIPRRSTSVDRGDGDEHQQHDTSTKPVIASDPVSREEQEVYEQRIGSELLNARRTNDQSDDIQSQLGPHTSNLAVTVPNIPIWAWRARAEERLNGLILECQRIGGASGSTLAAWRGGEEGGVYGSDGDIISAPIKRLLRPSSRKSGPDGIIEEEKSPKTFDENLRNYLRVGNAAVSVPTAAISDVEGVPTTNQESVELPQLSETPPTSSRPTRSQVQDDHDNEQRPLDPALMTPDPQREKMGSAASISSSRATGGDIVSERRLSGHEAVEETVEDRAVGLPSPESETNKHMTSISEHPSSEESAKGNKQSSAMVTAAALAGSSLSSLSDSLRHALGRKSADASSYRSVDGSKRKSKELSGRLSEEGKSDQVDHQQELKAIAHSPEHASVPSGTWFSGRFGHRKPYEQPEGKGAAQNEDCSPLGSAEAGQGSAQSRVAKWSDNENSDVDRKSESSSEDSEEKRLWSQFPDQSRRHPPGLIALEWEQKHLSKQQTDDPSQPQQESDHDTHHTEKSHDDDDGLLPIKEESWTSSAEGHSS